MTGIFGKGGRVVIKMMNVNRPILIPLSRDVPFTTASLGELEEAVYIAVRIYR